jgi:hypothetical protein
VTRSATLPTQSVTVVSPPVARDIQTVTVASARIDRASADVGIVSPHPDADLSARALALERVGVVSCRTSCASRGGKRASRGVTRPSSRPTLGVSRCTVPSRRLAQGYSPAALGKPRRERL